MTAQGQEGQASARGQHATAPAARSRVRGKHTREAARLPQGARLAMPTTAQFAAERRRLERNARIRRASFEVAGAIAIAGAVAVLVSTLAFPLFRIYGDSMSPTLESGDIVVGSKIGGVSQGDLVSFSLNNKVLVKRVIGLPGDWVDIAADGTVSVNGQTLDEPYLQAGSKSLGSCDITLPYQVPDGRYFVLGDNRAVSMDSRVSAVGCVAADQVEGKLELRIWPLQSWGGLS